eukprot:TRINITY_DN21_c0_g3_i1.p1 TRINITY_DN21_c0_g3~~TRINITY_DN21_c0_g3_i1.p1  ORF type:complete len:583 (-),score=107.27 TRINITY_DN21_c0_g3_i1:67-1752(-)
MLVFGAPKFANTKKFSKIFQDLDVSFSRAKKVVGLPYGLLQFEDEKTKESAAIKINGMTFKGKRLKVEDRETKTFEMENRSELSVQDALTPWHNKPYAEQLELKKKDMENILSQVTRQIRTQSKYLIPQWLKYVKGPVCPLEGIKPSPVTEGYRNKAEFSIGFNKQHEPTVGFLLGQYQHGVTAIEDPTPCKNVSEDMKILRNLFQTYLSNNPHPPWDKIKQVGFWRLMTIRANRSNQTMIMFQLNPGAISQDLYDLELKNLVKWVTETCNQSSPRVSSLYVQEHGGVSNVAPHDAEIRHLWGEMYIYEELLGLKFRISPVSFFQPNTYATEVLYGIIGDWVGDLDKNTSVIDICCGTGTIGLSLASKAKSLIGVDIVEDAIFDAKHNANLNNIENSTFLAGKAEDILQTMLNEHTSGSMIGIVDPPRPGIHIKTVTAIRSCPVLKQLIYVSCNPQAFVIDAAHLCRSPSKTMPGIPFKPVKSICVDMLPHSNRVELVTLFERVTDTNDQTKEKTQPIKEKTEEPVTENTTELIKEQITDMASEPIKEQTGELVIEPTKNL